MRLLLPSRRNGVNQDCSEIGHEWDDEVFVDDLGQPYVVCLYCDERSYEV